jgi:tRNA-dihydrouridine synthase B
MIEDRPSQKSASNGRARNGSSILEELQTNPFVLAPMAGITDRAFRSFMRAMGCGPVVTELVSATGLRYASDKTRRLMEFGPDQHPVGVQIFGENLGDLAVAAKEIEQMGADFVDLNFGCPVPKVVKKGAGAAVLKDPVFLGQILKTVKGAVSIPVTIKVRTGWDEGSRNATEVASIAANEGIAWMAIHGRTRAQGYSGEADWDYIAKVKASAQIPILGNGDIHSGERAQQRLRDSSCDGVLIGRGCLKNPWIFLEARGLPFEKEFMAVFRTLRRELEGFFDDHMVGLQLKKLSSWYSHGYPDSSQFRKTVFAASTKDQVWQIIEDYFSKANARAQVDTSKDAFLMGGHG